MPEWVKNVDRTLPYLLALLALIVFGPRIWPFLVVPLIATAVFAVTAWRTAKGKPRVFIPAFALLGGLLFWFLLLALGGSPGWLEVILTSVGMAFLISVESLAPAVLLLIYELVCMIGNFGRLTTVTPGSSTQLAGIAIIILRLTIIMFLASGITLYRFQPGGAALAAATTTGAGGPPPGAVPVREGLSEQAAEELRRLSALVTEGVLTREEFEAKKKKILGL